MFAGSSGLTASGTGTGLAFGVAAGSSTISAVGAPAVDISTAAITLPLSGLSSTNTTSSGVSLTNVGGTFSAPSGSTITKNSGSGAAFSINNSAAGTTVLSSTYGGAINNTSSTGSAVVVNTADTGSALSFTGAITDNPGQGVSLTGNTGATLSFSGGLTLNGTGSVFAATGGGTVTVTGTNTIGAATAPTTTALNVSNTTIGASDLTFQSISSNGAATGIVLNSTGALGSLTVTGDAGSANNNSGGTIQNATVGISLTNTRDVVLDQMNIHHTTQNGIDGFHVTNFSLTNSKVETTGTASIAGDYEVNAIAFMDRAGADDNTIDGTVTITGNVITEPERNAISIETWAGTISNLNVSGNTISGGTTSARIQDAVHAFAQGTTAGITTGAIQNNTISGFRFLDTSFDPDRWIGGNGIRLVTDTNASNPASTLGSVGSPFVISGNDVDGVGSNMIAVSALGRTASANVQITNNGTLGDPMSDAEGLGISLFFGGNGTFNGLVHSNVIQNIGQTVLAGSSGIGVQSDFGGNGGANTDVTNSNITVSSNTITNTDGNGILATGINNAGTFNIRIINNVVTTVPDLAARFGIRVQQSNVGTQPTVNLEITGNTTAGGNPVIGPPDGIGIRKQDPNTFCIEGLGATTSSPEASVNAQNPLGNGTTKIAGTNFTSCTVPNVP